MFGSFDFEPDVLGSSVPTTDDNKMPVITQVYYYHN